MTALRLDISELIAKSQAALIESTPVPIIYQDKVSLENNSLPLPLGQADINIYALWVRSNMETEWKLMYIGERQSKYGWNRIKQHLFSTPARTQSKLNYVRAAINAGLEVGVTAILVSPDSMRLAIEEALIKLNAKTLTDLVWNKKARG